MKLEKVYKSQSTYLLHFLVRNSMDISFSHKTSVSIKLKFPVLCCSSVRILILILKSRFLLILTLILDDKIYYKWLPVL